MARVSVIMNCLDCTRYVREAVNSVYAQTFPDWEIIFWDNASSEDVRGALAGYDDRLRYFRGGETVPLGAARNLAMAEAKGELIAFLDCDDIWFPDKIEKQIGFFEDQRVGLAYTDWIVFNDRGYNRARYGGIAAPEGWVFDRVLFDNFTCLSTLMVRNSLIREDGIEFDPRFTYIEDTDFIIRIARSWKFAYVSAALTRYRMHGASASATKVQGFRDEMDQMIENYSRRFPEFADKYAQSLRFANAKDRATDQWRSGNRRLARHLLRGQLLRNWRYPLIYLALFLPFRWVNWVRTRVSRRATGYYY